MRWAITLVTLGSLSVALSCASASKVGVPVSRGPSAAELQVEARAEAARGCYHCLVESAALYEKAEAMGALDARADHALVLILLAIREKELGLAPSNAEASARLISESLASTHSQLRLLQIGLRLASLVPPLAEGAASDGPRPRIADLTEFEQRTSVTETLDTLAPRDPFAAYLRLVEACAVRFSWDETKKESLAASTTAQHPASPLVLYRGALCRRQEAEGWKSLLALEPAFVEAHYFRGTAHLGRRSLFSAEDEFLKAANAIPRMSAAWSLLGSTRMLIEEYSEAAADFERALSIEPRQRGTLLSLARAQAYLGRFAEARETALRLVDLGNWYPFDARYWLAFAEYQLKEFKEADAHATDARKYNENDGDLARLLGLIAYQLDEIARARSEFIRAVEKNPNDCESRLYLGLIHGRGERWAESVESFLRARQCYATVEERLIARRAEIEAATMGDQRRTNLLASVAARLKAAQRSQRASHMGAAEGEAQRGAIETAIKYAEAAAEHEDFAVRAKALIERLKGALRK